MLVSQEESISLILQRSTMPVQKLSLRSISVFQWIDYATLLPFESCSQCGWKLNHSKKWVVKVWGCHYSVSALACGALLITFSNTSSLIVLQRWMPHVPESFSALHHKWMDHIQMSYTWRVVKCLCNAFIARVSVEMKYNRLFDGFFAAWTMYFAALHGSNAALILCKACNSVADRYPISLELVKIHTWSWRNCLVDMRMDTGLLNRS